MKMLCMLRIDWKISFIIYTESLFQYISSIYFLCSHTPYIPEDKSILGRIVLTHQSPYLRPKVDRQQERTKNAFDANSPPKDLASINTHMMWRCWFVERVMSQIIDACAPKLSGIPDAPVGSRESRHHARFSPLL
jgi:hypothetical protein